MIDKHATARWTGSLREGSGSLTAQSGALAGTPYSFATRFEDKSGANPEELIAAAHAGCYAMFLSALMSGAGIVPEVVEAKSTVSLDPSTAGSPTVTKVHLDVKVKAPTDAATIRDLADKAKANCPISKLLKAEISLALTVG
jgi:osmotically inducible protein OsmC